MIGEVSHAVLPDGTVRISVLMPSKNVTRTPSGFVIGATDIDWMDLAKRVLREFNSSERSMDVEAVAARVAQALSDAAVRGINGESEPETLRRRAVANILHRIADMVISGTIREFVAEWPSWNSTPADGITSDVAPNVMVGFTTSRTTREITLPIRVSSRGGKP